MMNNMKARLIKEKDWYDLYRIDEDGKRVTFASTQDYKQKLSLKNCQAIERGYDLDELVKIDKEKDLDFTDESSFRRGFYKALELMGDKKFTEEDVIRAMQDYSLLDISEDKIIQSLQQDEWDVEIEMMLAPKYYGYVPKLDTDGCLILKRV